jgi:hypothetical protein
VLSLIFMRSAISRLLQCVAFFGFSCVVNLITLAGYPLDASTHNI